jgi:acetolactate synthase-1/2/3 large subunit
MNKIKVSDYIIKRLEKEVKHVFLISGGGCIHLVDSLGKSNIKPICNLHEQACGIGAEAYSQYTNNLGVAIVTTGPGGTNIITPIASAWLDSIPLLVISGQVQQKDMVGNSGVRQLGFQEINFKEIVKPITKKAILLNNPEDIPEILEHSIDLAKSGRPGPVVLEIPLDIQAAQIDLDKIKISSKKQQQKTAIEEGLKSQIDSIINELNKSKRPIFLIGNGLRLSNGIQIFKEIIDKVRIPVLLTWKAADILDESHDLFVGRPGGVGQRGANFNQQNSDLIICLGARLDHGQIAYQSKFFAREAKKIIVDIDINEINKLNTTVDYKINKSCLDFLTEFQNQIHKLKTTYSDWLSHCKKTYNKYPVCLPEYYDFKSKRVNNYVFINELSKHIKENSIIIPGSSGGCSEVTFQSIKINKGTRIFNSQGLGSMGFALPASIGGCLAADKKEVITIDGDGGFFMNLQELELINRYQLPIKYFILNNNGYGSIKTTQRNHFNSKYVASDPSSGLTLPNIKQQAKAYKIKYFKIKNNKDLILNLKDILSYENAFICEVMIDENHVTSPKASVYKDKNGVFSTRPMEDLAPFLSREEFLENLLIKPIEYETI